MNTFLLIMAAIPWSIVFVVLFKYLRKTKVYGRFWVVSEQHLESFDGSKVPAKDLVMVKEIPSEPMDEEPSTGTENQH